MNHTRFAFSHDLMARGRVLAEGRMAFLTELYDTGRWRRYHNEQEFLAMVRECRAALDKWTELAPPLAPAAPTAAMLPTPRPLPTMFKLDEAAKAEPADDPLAAALAAVSLEMGLDPAEFAAA
jgi:uncharacterized repeat protein (TIGR03809 family)